MICFSSSSFLFSRDTIIEARKREPKNIFCFFGCNGNTVLALSWLEYWIVYRIFCRCCQLQNGKWDNEKNECHDNVFQMYEKGQFKLHHTPNASNNLKIENDHCNSQQHRHQQKKTLTANTIESKQRYTHTHTNTNHEKFTVNFFNFFILIKFRIL